jgi:hypothetical protein
MKKFNNLCKEALLITSIKPESDTSGPIEPVTNSKDTFSKTIDQFLSQQSPDDSIQPTDNVGEFGENQSEETESDVQLECTPDGLRVKFNGLEIVLPKAIIEKIKAHQEHEETESPEEEAEEHDTTSDESEDETTSDETEESDESEKNDEDSNQMFDTK